MSTPKKHKNRGNTKTKAKGRSRNQPVRLVRSNKLDVEMVDTNKELSRFKHKRKTQKGLLNSVINTLKRAPKKKDDTEVILKDTYNKIKRAIASKYHGFINNKERKDKNEEEIMRNPHNKNLLEENVKYINSIKCELKNLYEKCDTYISDLERRFPNYKDIFLDLECEGKPANPIPEEDTFDFLGRLEHMNI